MKVWVVSKGMAYEGDWVDGIYDTEEKAKIGMAAAEKDDKEKNWAPYTWSYEEWDVE